jgi:hypothetical protein
MSSGIIPSLSCVLSIGEGFRLRVKYHALKTIPSSVWFVSRYIVFMKSVNSIYAVTGGRCLTSSEIACNGTDTGVAARKDCSLRMKSRLRGTMCCIYNTATTK